MSRWRDPQFRFTLVLTPLVVLSSFLMWHMLDTVMPKWYDWPRLWFAGHHTQAGIRSIHSERYGKNDRYTRYTITYTFSALIQNTSDQRITATRQVRPELYRQLEDRKFVLIWYDPADPARSNIAGNFTVRPFFGPFFFCMVVGLHGMIAVSIVGMGISKMTAWSRYRRRN